MGLSKSVDTQYGQPATYWVVSKVSINNVLNFITAVMNGYVSQDAYNAGNSFISQQTMRIDLFTSNGDGTYSRNAQYDQIMTSGDVIGQLESAFQSDNEVLQAATSVTDAQKTAPTVNQTVLSMQTAQKLT
jgi:hypothetical protein